MDQLKSQELLREPDQDEIYSYIYELSKRDYLTTRVRTFAKRSFSFLILILSLTGLFFTAFYFFFLKNYMRNLREEILEYRNNVAALNNEIDRLTENETEFMHRIREYEDTFSKLKIVDGKIVDFDLTDRVEKNLQSIDSLYTDYKNIFRGNTAFRETALTFDLGTGEDLPYIYTILKRFDVRTTIFISNEMPASSYGSLFNERNLFYLSRLSELGCEFGNHTWSHYNLKSSLYETSKKKRLELSFVSDEILNEAAFSIELNRVAQRFQQETGITFAPFWRAPYGAIDHRILTIAAKAGYPNHVLWSANSEGPLDFYDYVKKRVMWVKDEKSTGFVLQKNPFYFSSTEMLARLKRWEQVDRHGFSGAIAISHLGTGRKTDKMIYILPEFISYFQEKGYHFVLVSEVINHTQDY